MKKPIPSSQMTQWLLSEFDISVVAPKAQKSQALLADLLAKFSTTTNRAN